MSLPAGVRDAALRRQPLRVGKGYAGESGTEPAGIDTQDQPSWPVVIIVLPVEGGGDLHDIVIVSPEGIHDADPRWQRSAKLNLPVEVNDPVGNGFHLPSSQWMIFRSSR